MLVPQLNDDFLAVLLVQGLQGEDVIGAPFLIACHAGYVIDLPAVQRLEVRVRVTDIGTV